MVKDPPLYALAFGFCLGLFFFTDYLGGRAGFHLSVPPLLPATLVPFGAAVYFAVRTMVTAVQCALRHKHIILPLLSVAALVGFWMLPRLILSHRAFLYGFRQNLVERITPEQLRLIAAESVQRLGPDDRSMAGPGKNLYRIVEDGPVWRAISDRSAIANLDDTLMLTHRPDGSVEITWGGALVGHWGVRIKTPRAVEQQDDADFLSVTSDIGVFMEKH